MCSWPHALTWPNVCVSMKSSRSVSVPTFPDELRPSGHTYTCCTDIRSGDTDPIPAIGTSAH